MCYTREGTSRRFCTTTQDATCTSLSYTGAKRGHNDTDAIVISTPLPFNSYHSNHDRLPVADAPLHSPAAVCARARAPFLVHVKLIVVGLSRQKGAREARPDLTDTMRRDMSKVLG